MKGAEWHGAQPDGEPFRRAVARRTRAEHEVWLRKHRAEREEGLRVLRRALRTPSREPGIWAMIKGLWVTNSTTQEEKQ